MESRQIKEHVDKLISFSIIIISFSSYLFIFTFNVLKVDFFYKMIFVSSILHVGFSSLIFRRTHVNMDCEDIQNSPYFRISHGDLSAFTQGRVQ